MPLALIFLVLLSATGALDRIESGAESVLQDSCFVFAWCKSLCNAPGTRKPRLVDHSAGGTTSPCFVHSHLVPSVLYQVSERCRGLLQSCLDTIFLHEKSYVSVGRRGKSALLGFPSQDSFPHCKWELM